MSTPQRVQAPARRPAAVSALRRATQDRPTLAGGCFAVVLLVAAAAALVRGGWVAALVLLAQAVTVLGLVVLHRRTSHANRLLTKLNRAASRQPEAGPGRRDSHEQLEVVRQLLLEAEGRRRLDHALLSQDQLEQQRELTEAITTLREELRGLRQELDRRS